MNKDRLFDEFMKLSTSDKKIVYESLIDNRKTILDKKIRYHKQKQNQKIINVFAEVFGVFNITSEDFKNIQEAALTFAIIKSHGHIDPNGEKEKRKHPERKIGSFNNAKQNMLEQLEYLLERERPSYFLEDYNKNKAAKPITPIEGIYNELKKLEFIPVDTKQELLTEKRILFRMIYGDFGTGKVRTGKIIPSLTKYIEFKSIKSSKNCEPDTKEYNILKDLISQYKNNVISHKNLGEVLSPMAEKGLLNIDEELDSFNSTQIKIIALSVLLGDHFNKLGDDLLKVNIPVENYTANFDFRGNTLQEFIDLEKELFNRYEKKLTKQHIEKIEQHYHLLFSLPNTVEELEEESRSYRNSYGRPYKDT